MNWALEAIGTAITAQALLCTAPALPYPLTCSLTSSPVWVVCGSQAAEWGALVATAAAEGAGAAPGACGAATGGGGPDPDVPAGGGGDGASRCGQLHFGSVPVCMQSFPTEPSPAWRLPHCLPAPCFCALSLPADPILGVTEAFKRETSADKLNLGVRGAVHDTLA